MPKSESKRKIGQGDLKVYQQGMAKKGGKLDKVGVSMHLSKGSLGEGIKKNSPPKQKIQRESFDPVKTTAEKGGFGRIVEKNKKKNG